MKRRTALRRSGRLVLLLLAVPRGARGARPVIVGVRVWPAEDYTRVTIESDQRLTARHAVTEAPLRLVVDLDGLELTPPLRELVGKVRPDDPTIAGVRVGQVQPRVVRLVFDLKQPIAPQQFTLAPVAAYRHRLVFDLYPSAPAADPLLALLRDNKGAAVDTDVVASASASSASSAASAPWAPSAPSAPSVVDAAPAAASAAAAAAAAASSAAPALRADTRAAVAAQAMQDTLGELIARLDRPVPIDAPAVQLPLPPAPVVSAAPATAAEQRRVRRLIIVALDPGHGGEDPGAVGPSGLREKDVVLAIALQLRERLNALPGIRVMLTRDGDFFVPLHERVRKARRVQADLFVSIHADAFLRPEARGASVFALSTSGATSSAARWMADRENAADVVGGVNLAVKDTQVLRALLDMSTAAQIKDSLRLGQEVLSRIGQVGRLHKREVEQAGFAVLKAPDIPSILVETAFISNPEEEDKLRDPAYRDKLVGALAGGIQRYFARNPPLARNRQL